jgi:hypothetical protein
MNVLGRIFLIIYSILWMAACGGLIALAWNDDKKLDIEAGDLNLQAFITSGDAERWLFSVLLGALAVLGLLTLILAVIPSSRRSTGSIQMRGSDGSLVEVQASAIEALLRDDLEQLPDVRSAQPLVRASGSSVETDIKLAIEPSATIADVTAAANEATRAVLRDQVGATSVKNPILRIAYDPSARPLSAGKTKPQAAAPIPSPPPPPPTLAAQESSEASGADTVSGWNAEQGQSLTEKPADE